MEDSKIKLNPTRKLRIICPKLVVRFLERNIICPYLHREAKIKSLVFAESEILVVDLSWDRKNHSSYGKSVGKYCLIAISLFLFQEILHFNLFLKFAFHDVCFRLV